MRDHDISQRRACRLVGVDPKAVRRERPPDCPEIRKEMQEIAGKRRRFGYHRIGVMLERKGMIIVMSSIAGFAPVLGRSGYCASKHALHGLFSNVYYPRFSGTSVPRDFVEFPSQVNEMWADWPEVLANYARHYQTGELLPEERQHYECVIHAALEHFGIEQPES